MLDRFGRLAVAELIYYVPAAQSAVFVAFKHGFGHKQGWVFLLTFSLVRDVGAILTIVYQKQSAPSISLIVAATILAGIGLAPLLLATHAFISKIAASVALMETRLFSHIARILVVVALVLGIVAGSMTSPSNSQHAINTGRTILRVTSILFIAVFAILFGLHLKLWLNKNRLGKGHRKLLIGVSIALPFLLVRLIYSLLGAFASSTTSQFSTVNGDWRIYISMNLLMEYFVVITYLTVGILAPLRKDEAIAASGGEPGFEMEPRGQRSNTNTSSNQ